MRGLTIIFTRFLLWKTPSGSSKYVHMVKIVKTCLSLQNGNAPCERSLSDNKNTVTKERTALKESTVKGLRIVKEFVRKAGGAHNVCPLLASLFHFIKPSSSFVSLVLTQPAKLIDLRNQKVDSYLDISLTVT